MPFFAYQRYAIVALALSILMASSAGAIRVKEVALLEGAQSIEVRGFGLVFGLNGSGDTQQALYTNQALAGLMTREGLRLDPIQVRTRNVALVRVTASLPPFATPGTRVDVTVSSVGDARSLRGGVLELAPLRDANNTMFVMAGGSLAVGGFSASGAGSTVTKNHPTVGRISGGGIIRREFIPELPKERLIWALHRADYTTAQNMAVAFDKAGLTSAALNSRQVQIQVPEEKRGNIVKLIAEMESLEIEVDNIAKVVINPRTGTVVMGANVSIGPVALAHGGLQVTVSAQNDVSQPNALATGQSTRLSNASVAADDVAGRVHLVEKTADLKQLVTALNALGVTPNDLIDILQALRQAGALNAEIEVQ